jgi:zinc protease
MRARALLLLALAACGGKKDDAPDKAAPPAAPPADARPAPLAGDIDRTLTNGLRLILSPVPDSGGVALLVLFRIGGDHDPPGQSGLAHLVEHMLVTAANPAAPARTADEWMKRYPLGWNAQTGSDYTVIATVFAPDQLPAELAEAAGRMTELRVEPDDMTREVPRVIDEVTHMFDWASLGAPNRARERARPAPERGRKGGLPAHLQKLTREQVRARANANYRAGNAIVVIAGELDEEAEFRAIAAFGKLDRGVPPSPPHAIPPAVAAIDRFDPAGAEPTLGCISYRAPLPADPLYPALLVAAGMLMRAGQQPPAGEPKVQVRFAPLDEPEVLTVCANAKVSDLPETLIRRLDTFTSRTLSAPATPLDAAFAERAYGPLLRASADAAAGAQALYTVAFGRARRTQLDLDPMTLRPRLRTVTDLSPILKLPRGRAVAVGE